MDDLGLSPGALGLDKFCSIGRAQIDYLNKTG